MEVVAGRTGKSDLVMTRRALKVIMFVGTRSEIESERKIVTAGMVERGSETRIERRMGYRGSSKEGVLEGEEEGQTCKLSLHGGDLYNFLQPQPL